MRHYVIAVARSSSPWTARATAWAASASSTSRRRSLMRSSRSRSRKCLSPPGRWPDHTMRAEWSAETCLGRPSLPALTTWGRWCGHPRRTPHDIPIAEPAPQFTPEAWRRAPTFT